MPRSNCTSTVVRRILAFWEVPAIIDMEGAALAAADDSATMQLTLREINPENWQQCIRLRVADHQATSIPSNVFILAESKIYSDRVPLAIYDGDKLVGMLVCSFDAGTGRAWIHHMMIDAAEQNKGYTRHTMKQILRQLREIDGCKVISVEYRPGDRAWEPFYEAFGFKRNGLVSEKGNVVASLYVEPPSEAGQPATG